MKDGAERPGEKDAAKERASSPEQDAGVDRKTGQREDPDLLKKIEELEQKAAEHQDKYLRAVAELENYKKRSAKERLESVKFANEALLRDILPLVDSMDRALEHACNSDDFEAFKTGLKLVQDQLLCCLGKHGVEKIEALGKDFDPHIHEAMLQVEGKEHQDNKVMSEFEKGYLLHGRLLKPAKVSVCKCPSREDGNEPAGNSSEE